MGWKSLSNSSSVGEKMDVAFDLVEEQDAVASIAGAAGSGFSLTGVAGALSRSKRLDDARSLMTLRFEAGMAPPIGRLRSMMLALEATEVALVAAEMEEKEEMTEWVRAMRSGVSSTDEPREMLEAKEDTEAWCDIVGAGRGTKTGEVVAI